MSQYTGLAIRYHETGNPSEVIQGEMLDYPEPAAGKVLIQLLAAPIHPSDFGMIAGSYGRSRDLPAVAGREGVGQVVVRGDGVESVEVGQRVRMPENKGVWQRYVIESADALTCVPDDISVEQAAMAFVNPPTAWRILEDFIQLKPGDWVIQNAANSAVGQCLIQLAHERGLHTLNVVRDAKWEVPLKEMGADVVVLEDSDYFKQLKTLTGGAKPRLGLNSVGGDSVSRIIRCMADAGVVVTFGGMASEPVRFPTRYLIFNDVRLTGFWMDRWYRNASDETRDAMLNAIYAAIRAEKLHCPVDTVYPLEEYKEALAHAASGGRNGKVLFRVD